MPRVTATCICPGVSRGHTNRRIRISSLSGRGNPLRRHNILKHQRMKGGRKRGQQTPQNTTQCHMETSHTSSSSHITISHHLDIRESHPLILSNHTSLSQTTKTATRHIIRLQQQHKPIMYKLWQSLSCEQEYKG